MIEKNSTINEKKEKIANLDRALAIVLERKIELEAELNNLKRQVLIEESSIKVGDIVMNGANEYKITRIEWRCHPYFGRRFLKSGNLGKTEHNLFGIITKSENRNRK